MNRLPPIFHSLLPVICCMLALTSCNQNKLEKIPRTGFISHYVENEQKEKPFAAYWVNRKLKDTTAELTDNKLYLYVKPVNVTYLEMTPYLEKHQNDVTHLKNYFDESLKKAFKKREQEVPQFVLAEQPKRGAYTMEVAILSLRPTPAKGNVLAQALGAVKKGAGLIFGPLENKGHIAMAARFRDPRGRLLAELADYSTDQSALIGIDFKDFEHYAHHRRRIDSWSKELAETFTSPRNAKIEGPARISLIPF